MVATLFRKPGDRVVSDNTGHACGMCHACAKGRFLLCQKRLGLGYTMDGGFTEFVRIPGDILAVHPRAIMRLIRPLGRVVKMAWSRPFEAGLSPLMFKGGEIHGHFGYDALSWEGVMRLADSGAIDYRKFISRTFSLDQWREAFEGVEEKRYVKAVFNAF